MHLREENTFESTNSNCKFRISDLPQPFVGMKISKPADKAQSDVCGPQAMTFARFNSRDDVFAFKRLLHEHSYAWFALQKKKEFHTIFTNCYKTGSSFAEIANLTQWTVGDPHVSPELFEGISFQINSCSEKCFFMKMISGNQFKIGDYPCGKTLPIICRIVSREFRSEGLRLPGANQVRRAACGERCELAVQPSAFQILT